MPPSYLQRESAAPEDVDPSIGMPYGMHAAGLIGAINDVYAYLHAINVAGVDHGYGRLEELMQPAGFSGLLSQSFMAAVAKAFASESPGLTLNQYSNGRPDLVPRAHYPGDAVKNGDEGVELKTSRSKSGWQGHNPEGGWLMVFQIAVDTKTVPIYDRDPTRVDRVLIAKLKESDWNFSGRSAGSRRTPTASVNQAGLAKLERGDVYVRARN